MCAGAFSHQVQAAKVPISSRFESLLFAECVTYHLSHERAAGHTPASHAANHQERPDTDTDHERVTDHLQALKTVSNTVDNEPILGAFDRATLVLFRTKSEPL